MQCELYTIVVHIQDGGSVSRNRYFIGANQLPQIRIIHETGIIVAGRGMSMLLFPTSIAGIIMLVLASYATIFNGILVIIVPVVSGSIICVVNFCTLQLVKLTVC